MSRVRRRILTAVRRPFHALLRQLAPVIQAMGKPQRGAHFSTLNSLFLTRHSHFGPHDEPILPSLSTETRTDRKKIFSSSLHTFTLSPSKQQFTNKCQPKGKKSFFVPLSSSEEAKTKNLLSTHAFFSWFFPVFVFFVEEKSSHVVKSPLATHSPSHPWPSFDAASL
jgi:hypothetical protein